MKKLYFKLLTLLFIGTLGINSFGQTTLAAGDIAVIGIVADTPDDFGVLLLVDIEAGTTIKFTDSGWLASGSFRGGEGGVMYTAPSAVNAGTVISLVGNASDFTTANDAIIGTNGMALSTSGDQIIAYQGDSDSPTLLYAAQSNSTEWQADATSSTNSALPAVLVDGTTAISFGFGAGEGDEYDNISYDFGTQLNTGTPAELLAAIGNESNWIGDNTILYDFTTASFTVNLGDMPPSATFNPADAETFIAIDQNITITFDELIYTSGGTVEIVDADLAALITLKETDAAGADVPFTATYSNADPYVITIDPTSDLANGTDYYVAFGSVFDDANNENTGENATFTTIPLNYITLTEPVGGEKYYAGEEVNFTWTSANVATVDVFVYIPENDAWELILDDVASDGSELFTIPADAEYGTTYRAAITDITDATVTDTSEVFTVVSTPTINAIQSDHTAGLSNYDGDVVLTSGIITFSGNGEYVIQDGAGSWNGIYVYDYGFDLTSVEGDSVTIEATVGNYHEVTQLTNVVSLTVNESGKPLPAITTVTTAELTEEYEGVLVKVVNAQVTNESVASGVFEINDGSGALNVDDNLYYNAEAGILNGRDLTITGIGYDYDGMQLLPRYADDIVSATDTVGSTIYDVNQGTLVISNIPSSEDLATLESNLTPADTATFDVFDADGTTPATILDDTKLVIVTAADGITSSIYTLSINVVLSSDATVSSTVYTVDNDLETITDIFYGTDLATFESNINAAVGGSFDTYEADGTTLATDLQTGYLVIGVAEDASTKTYTITIDAPSSDATVTSDVYTVDDVAETIVDVPFGTTLAVFEGNLTSAAGATFVTYLADGVTEATDLQTGYKVVVTAQDASTKTYTVTLQEELIDLFFSEYVEGSGSNKAIEIYNPNNVSVNLSQYSVQQSHNGTGFGVDGIAYVLPLTGTIGAGEVYVIANGSASAEILAVADISLDYAETQGAKVPSFNGDDALGLFMNDVLIDVIGIPSEDPGSAWDVAGVALATVEHTLLRKPTVAEGNTDWASSAGTDAANSEWFVYGQDYIANLGAVTVLASDATLSDLQVDGTTVTGFDAATLDYTVVLDYGTTTVPTVTAIAADSYAAEPVVTPATDLSSATAADRTTTILVTAQDGTTTATYSIQFDITAPSTDATLSDLQVDGTTLADFASDKYDYEVQLAAGTTTVPTVTATENESNAEAVVTPATDLGGDAAARTTTVVVTAQDGTTQLTYTVLFTRATATGLITLDMLKVYPTTVVKNILVTNTEIVDYVQILNLTGSVAKTVEVNGADMLDIDLTELSAGMYILKAVAGTDVSTHRIIKE